MCHSVAAPYLMALIAALSCAVTASARNVFINEIHYDNAGADTGEAVEIVAPAGTDLSAYELLFYNGASGGIYGGIVLGGTAPNQGGSGFGAMAFPFEGIQNGGPDGIALFHIATDSVVQFLSYEGVITAVGGAADEEKSTDIEVAETASTAVDTSLQLIGAGSGYGDFRWTRGAAASFGTLNAGQILEGGAVGAALSLTLSQNHLVESAGSTVEARVLILPPPEQPATFSVTLSGTAAAAPAKVTTDAAGVAVFSISVADNAIDDGDRPVRVTVSDAAGDRTASTVLTVVDDDRMPVKGEAARVATFNLLNGVGGRGSAGYNAVAASLSRVEPDVIAFQEVDSVNGFRALRSLLGDIAFETDAIHLATVDDDHALDSYNGGDFNSGRQSLAIASRYPIKRVVQIGRDVPDARREITRFPLYAEIDIPWAEDADDLHVICIHYKAGTRDADRFRRAVEAYRTLTFLADEGISAETHNVIVLGDFNENTGNFQPSLFHTGRTTFADGSTFPNGFALGDDISGANAITIPYDAFPSNLFGGHAYKVPSARHADRKGINTFIVAEGVRLDYIVLSDRLNRNGNRFTEVFNSEVDVDFDGLPKQGHPVDDSVSRAASDHYPLFGDYWLRPVDRITVSFSIATPSLEESSSEKVRASIVLTPAPAAGEVVTVSLSDALGDLAVPSTVRVVGPDNSAAFEIEAAQDGHPDRNRTVSLIAEAGGYATGYGGILVENVNASGILLISQMLHTGGADGAAALEIVNASRESIRFTETPAEARIFANGNTTAGIVIALDRGMLAPGEVMVLGNAALSGEVGELEFLQVPLAFNGDDAIEIVLGGVRSDVFGTIGEDPGTAWVGGGISTRAANLVLKDTIGIGSRGWSDPSLRFEGGAIPGAPHLGTPPALEDPYIVWIESFGLQRQSDGHPDADPDGDDLTNAGEFAFFTHPQVPDRHATTGKATVNPVFIRRPDDRRVVYRLESSGDLAKWGTEPFAIRNATILPDGREQLTAVSLLKVLRSTRYHRFRVTLP